MTEEKAREIMAALVGGPMPALPDNAYDADGRVLKVGDFVVFVGDDMLAENTAIVREVGCDLPHLISVHTDHSRFVSVMGCASGWRWLDPTSTRARRFTPAPGNPNSKMV